MSLGASASVSIISQRHLLEIYAGFNMSKLATLAAIYLTPGVIHNAVFVA